MQRKRRFRITYANVVASLALFAALGGSSYAAITLPKNSVAAKQIRAGGVRSSEVKDGALTSRDFASGTLLQGPKGEQGAPGAAGTAGPKGEPGEHGAPGQPGAAGTARAFAFVNPGPCAAAPGPCTISKAKNILGARRVLPGTYCVQVAAEIDLAATTTAAGVDFQESDNPEGAGSAMSSSTNPVCGAAEFAVVTQTLQIVDGSVISPQSNGVAFWVLVP